MLLGVDEIQRISTAEGVPGAQQSNSLLIACNSRPPVLFRCTGAGGLCASARMDRWRCFQPDAGQDRPAAWSLIRDGAKHKRPTSFRWRNYGTPECAHP